MTFVHTIRIYFEDTDTGGIVFYANYLRFFERARTEWLRAGGPGAPGVSQQNIADELGLMFVVRSTAVDYRRPARLDDRLQIVSKVERLGRVGIDFHQEAYAVAPDASPDAARGATPDAPHSPLIAVGRIKVACVARDTLRPHAIPDAVARIFDVPGR